jgi:hypothetical protein
MNPPPNYNHLNNYDIKNNHIVQQRKKQNNILNEYYSTSNGQNGLLNCADFVNQYNYNSFDRKELNEQNIDLTDTSVSNLNNHYAPLVNSNSNHRSLSEPRHHNNIIRPQLQECNATQQSKANPQLPPPPVIPNYVQLQHQHQLYKQNNQNCKLVNSSSQYQPQNNRKTQVNFQTPLESNQHAYHNQSFDNNYLIQQSYYNQNVEKQQQQQNSSTSSR